MTVGRAIRWWPGLGVLGMVFLGWAVGRGSTAVDDWASTASDYLLGHHPHQLLVFADWGILGPLLGLSVGIALERRQWRLAAIAVTLPPVAVVLTEVLKPLFGRHKDGHLSYPSGHSALVIAVSGVLVMVLGHRLWTLAAAFVLSALGMLGEIACGFHYLTDTIGAALYTTALVSVAMLISGYSASSSASTSSERSTLV